MPPTPLTPTYEVVLDFKHALVLVVNGERVVLTLRESPRPDRAVIGCDADRKVSIDRAEVREMKKRA